MFETKEDTQGPYRPQRRKEAPWPEQAWPASLPAWNHRALRALQPGASRGDVLNPSYL